MTEYAEGTPQAKKNPHPLALEARVGGKGEGKCRKPSAKAEGAGAITYLSYLTKPACVGCAQMNARGDGDGGRHGSREGFRRGVGMAEQKKAWASW